MSPKIMVIRHAEQPADPGPPTGVDVTSAADAESLIVQGWQRAGALASLFAPSFGPLQNTGLATPRFAFTSAVKHYSDSQRPMETLIPLCAKLGLMMNAAHAKDDYATMVPAAQACAGPVIICWQHQDIPAIANQILGNSTTAPQTWPGTRFDVVWVFDWNAAQNAYSFSQVPQCLLAGDLDGGIS